MDKHILIVAGGKGVRMKSEVPKQFVELNGMPIVMRTIDAFSVDHQIDQITMVIPNGYLTFWKELCEKHHFHAALNIIEGGPQRYHSVKRGLSMIPNNALVAIHDAVRPFITKELLNTGFKIAIKKERIMPKKTTEINKTSKRRADLLAVSRFMLWWPYFEVFITSARNFPVSRVMAVEEFRDRTDA